MNHRSSPLYWSFSAGTWFQTQVRISVFFPLIVLVLCLRVQPWQAGAAFSGLLFLSILAHEFGHIVAARSTGGTGSEILLWPLGGLAFARPGTSFYSRWSTPAAGPFVNLVLCAVCLPAMLASKHWLAALNPLVFPPVELTEDLVSDIWVLAFSANWLLLLINLVPIYPLDGGQILRVVLERQFDTRVAEDVYLKVGLFLSFVLMLSGLMIDSALLVFFGAMILALNLIESQQMYLGESYEETFMGYDFSAGYTSLEDKQAAAAPRKERALKRWLRARREKKQARALAKAQAAEQQLDAILQKLHQQGESSLTAAERRVLQDASVRYRNREKND